VKIIAIIPARSGSKRLPDKNIRLCNGKPLIVYSIEQAKMSKYIDRVIVSTDSECYADISKTAGAEIPFIRPQELASDTATDLDVFRHALDWLVRNENYKPDVVVHLRPTHPVRDVTDIDNMIERLLNDENLDSVRSISPTKHTPYKMWLMDTENKLSPVAVCDIKDAYNAPFQTLPPAYMQNACIDVIRADVITEKNSMSGRNISGYIQNYDFDIDTEGDFLRAELHLMMQEKNKNNKKLTFCIDIDGIIAYKNTDLDYSKAAPNLDNIKQINNLKDQGHSIILFTARGYKTGIDWEQITKTQLHKWGVKFSELKFGKPSADIYIDDRFLNLEDLKWLSNLTI
jgi:CMP-N-acetylneuraminic acid synthetase